MGTVIRAEVSASNPYWISKHRYFELKHYCLQYPEWKRGYIFYSMNTNTSSVVVIRKDHKYADMTSENAMKCAYFSEKIDQIERLCKEAGGDLYAYLLDGVTNGYPYTKLRTKLSIPCCKETYYECYRKFFWLLSKERR